MVAAVADALQIAASCLASIRFCVSYARLFASSYLLVLSRVGVRVMLRVLDHAVRVVFSIMVTAFVGVGVLVALRLLTAG
jgi:hypothetical protein